MINLMRRSCLLILLTFSAESAFSHGMSALFAGVDTIHCNNVSAVLGLTDSIVPLVVGDELTSTFPATAAVASMAGGGYTFAIGQEGFFTDPGIVNFDNLRFATNVIGWLDQQNRKRVMIVTNHDEWNGYGTTILRIRLAELGYTVTLSLGVITAAKLQNVDVLFVGNLWGTIGEDEIAAIDQFHNSGGGLFLMGVGWSWLP